MAIGQPYKCLRCQYEWYGRVEWEPAKCPSCTSYFWDKPPKDIPVA